MSNDKQKLVTGEDRDELKLQCVDFDNVTDLDSENFSIESGKKYFMIKNENNANIILEVKPARGTEFVSTTFYPGWNIEMVKEIKTNTVLTAEEIANIKWGR